MCVCLFYGSFSILDVPQLFSVLLQKKNDKIYETHQ
jgi:hypothetical protein